MKIHLMCQNFYSNQFLMPIVEVKNAANFTAVQGDSQQTPEENML